ncbi:MAG: 2OG-Fe(II) oxygenase [Burkholderiales bacterium]
MKLEDPGLQVVGGQFVPYRIGREAYPSTALVWSHVLPSALNASLLDAAVEHQSEFEPTETEDDAEDYRRSLLWAMSDSWRQAVVDRLLELEAAIKDFYQLRRFRLSSVESQFTTHNDGNFYKVHNDNGTPRTSDRAITFVYYLCKEPQPFTGGQLRIYDSIIKGVQWCQGDTFFDLQPTNNTLVVFLSRYYHEVLRVACPSGAFDDGRFTVNGWFRGS